MIDWDLITREKCYGTLKGLCCLSVEQMWLLKARLQNASFAEVQEFHKYVCACEGGGGGTTPPDPKPPVDPVGCQTKDCNCKEVLTKYCADTAWKAKLTGYAVAMTGLISVMASAIISPGGAAAVSALKDYVDSIYVLMKMCVTGEASKDVVADFCSQHSSARAVVDVVPGVSVAFNNLEGLLEPILKACCADWDKPVPLDATKRFANDWGTMKEAETVATDRNAKQQVGMRAISDMENPTANDGFNGGFFHIDETATAKALFRRI